MTPSRPRSARRRAAGRSAGGASRLSDEQIEWIAECLGKRWSPEQICARLALANGGRAPCSHTWLYATFHRLRLEGDDLHRNLRRRGKKRAPKGTDFARVSARSLRSVQDNINNRPMKLHGWLSRNQAYNRNVASLRSVL